MKTVGASEGKARFSALLDDAERGETTVVTKNGRPVARMSPITNGMSFREALKRVSKPSPPRALDVPAAFDETSAV